MKNLLNKLSAVTIGDINGVGIHILIKEWKKKKIKNFIIFSNIEIILSNLKNNIKKKEINIINSFEKEFNYKYNKLNIFNIDTKNIHSNSLKSLEYAYYHTKTNNLKGIITLPLDKNLINKFADKNFIDHTTYFSNLENKKNTNMIFFHNNKFFIPLTIHIELKSVYKIFKNKNLIINKIKSLNNSLIKDFNISKPKLIIAGINPHAGENGLISNDDKKYLNPIIKNLKNNKIDITGPISGDAIVNKNNLKNYDAFIFTFHDQALIPFKLLSQYKGINYTSNLSFIRISPSHGTAKDTIKNKQFSSLSILNCFKIINKIYKNRIKFD